jgi:hypothetical protein
MKLRSLFLILVLAVPIGGCSTVANLAVAASSSTPTQVNTLADALQAATLATNAVDAYVNIGNPTRATLLELQTLNNGLHTALTTLQAANAAGQSLAMASFNAALQAFNAYSTSAGVKH